jgi:hypothetical protein
MAARPWTPSKRSQELISVLWDAFLDGDRCVRIEHPSTRRYTGESIVWNGIAEWVDQDAGRIRLSDAQLEANGILNRDWQTEAEGLAAMEAEDAAA